MAGHALVIVDMIRDNVNTQRHGHIDVEAGKIIPNILAMSEAFRKLGGKVVFACDSFMEGDFIFQGRMPPHAIRGTGGDQPIPELNMKPSDLFLPKRRMSSFYKTDLDQTLRTWGVDTVVVCGIVTNVCVLLTAMDAIQNDFRTVIVADACACHKPAIHEATLQLFRGFVLAPLFRIMTADEMIHELEQTAENVKSS
ncbi:MAG TPA: isochorismatase family cysteine hydrolase [Desulfomonilaceae bacterium]|nr:isochorismatase family cysteine hydrolase [Desulfomonilaceae bacterium]